MDENELAQYYTINFEKFMEMIKQIDGLYNVLSALIKEYATANEISDWENTPIPELSGYFAAVNEIRSYLDDIINNPTEEEIELMIKHEIKDVIISLADLNALNTMFGAIQEFSDRLYEKHKIATNIQ
jgi:hypothetical protein